MVLVDTLVAEDAADFVHLVQTTNYKTFQVQFGGNTKVELLVKSIVVGDKGSRVGAGRYGHQDRGIHLNEPATIQKPADPADDAAALNKGVGDFRVGDKIQVALAIARFHVAEAVPLFG